MAERVFCGNCGGLVRLPANFAKAKIRCESCGYYAEVPEDQRFREPSAPQPQTPFDDPPAKKQKPKTRTPPESYSGNPLPVQRPTTGIQDAHDHRAKFEEDSSIGPPLLSGDQNISDDNDSVTPYAVPGTGLKPCPHCRGGLPLDAVFCVHCGTDLGVGFTFKPKREFTPIDHTWGEGWSRSIRLQILLVMQILNIVLLIGGTLARGDNLLDRSVIVTNIFFNILHTALQAFLLGTYDSIQFTRDPRGKCKLFRTRRVAFIPSKPMKISLNHHGLGVLPWHQPGIFGWMIFLYLFLCAVVPGVLFYFVVIRPERFNVAFCDEYQGVQEHVFRSKNLAQATEIAKTIADANGMKFYKVL